MNLHYRKGQNRLCPSLLLWRAGLPGFSSLTQWTQQLPSAGHPHLILSASNVCLWYAPLAPEWLHHHGTLMATLISRDLDDLSILR